MMTLPDKKKHMLAKNISTGAQTPQKRGGQTSSFGDPLINRNFTEEPGAGTYDSSMSLNIEI